MIHIVLFQPEIPPNTGNIARLCACNDFSLHFVHPLGFSLTKKHLLRAGLDYWRYLNLTEHASWEGFLSKTGREARMYFHFFSSRGKKNYWEVEYGAECYLIFGSETRGLPDKVRKEFQEQFITIPMQGKGARCLNLSNSVSIAAYEVLRQHRL